MTRGRALLLMAAAPLLARCAARALRVGSKDFVESVIVAEIYSLALECNGMPVERHMIEGNTDALQRDLSRGRIDLYPEYTGTGLSEVLRMNPKADLATLRSQYEKRFGCTWLEPARANDSQSLVTRRRIAEKFDLWSLSQCARKAPELRLASTPDFTTRPDSLPGLHSFYGGFRFKSIIPYDIGLQYEALLAGKADVAVAFSTDAQIDANRLVLLKDNRGFWPAYNVAPVIRQDAPVARVASILNAVSAHITDQALRGMNVAVQIDGQDPAAVAWRFVSALPAKSPPLNSPSGLLH